MARLAFLGDLHAGKGIDLSPSRLDEQEAALEAALDIARTARCDAVVTLGDLWDKRKPTPDEVLAVVRPLRHHVDQGGCPIIGIPGNHEVSSADGGTMPAAVGLTGLAEMFSEPSIRIVGDTAVCLLPWVPTSRLDLILEARHGDRVDRDELFTLAAELLVETCAGLAQVDTPRKVLGLHWSVSQTVLPSGLPVDELREVVLPMDALLELGFDAIVGAHIHRPGLYGGRFAYVGPPLPLDHGRAEGDHGVWIVDTTPLGTQFELMPIRSPGFETVDLTEGEVEWMAQGNMPALAPALKRYLRVRYSATEKQARRIDLAKLREHAMEYGPVRVDIEATVERPHRQRGVAIDQAGTRLDQLAAFLDAQGVNGSVGAAMLAKAETYL